MNCWLDGRMVSSIALPARTGIAPFETMGATAGALPLWEHHLARLVATAGRLALPFTPSLQLRAAAQELLRDNGHHDGVLRLLLLPHHDAVHMVLTTRARSPLSRVQLLPTIVPRPGNAPPGDVKAEPRAYYDAVRQQAQDGGADDGIVVASDGTLLEASFGTLWLRLQGQWVTPPLDGRVLPGIGRALLFAVAGRHGVALRERVCDLGDLHRAEALAHGNAVYGPRPAGLCGTEPAVAIVDSELGALWRAATGR